jgi:hypothetical protein
VISPRSRKEEEHPQEANTAEIPPEVPEGIEDTGIERKTNGITA